MTTSALAKPKKVDNTPLGSLNINLISLVRPLTTLLPSIDTPLKTPSFHEKTIWTSLAVLVYLIASQVPLFGVLSQNKEDPLSWVRIMMASNRGTLMDLGISPVITSSYVMQFLATIGLIKVNPAIKEDSLLNESFQKLIAIVMTIGYSLVQILSGFYGNYEQLGFYNCFIIFTQLLISGIIIILLDELLQKGYGLGNGVNLFIVANLCEKVIWNALSPKVFYTGRGIEFEGCIVGFFHLLFTRKSKLLALREIFFRNNLPNLQSLLSTLFIFAFIVYLQSLSVHLPISSRKHKGLVNTYPIKLLYTSTSPVIVQGYVVSHFATASRFLYQKFPTNFFVKLLGVWDFDSRDKMPISGISYYIFPPSSPLDALKRPFFTLIYLFVTTYTSAIMSKAWLESNKETAHHVFENLKSQDMQLKGTRDINAVKKLDEYITAAAHLGGALTSLVVVFCDVFSVLGSGSNIFLAASIIHQYLKMVAKENARRMGKAVIE